MAGAEGGLFIVLTRSRCRRGGARKSAAATERSVNFGHHGWPVAANSSQLRATAPRLFKLMVVLAHPTHQLHNVDPKPFNWTATATDLLAKVTRASPPWRRTHDKYTSGQRTTLALGGTALAPIAASPRGNWQHDDLRGGRAAGARPSLLSSPSGETGSCWLRRG